MTKDESLAFIRETKRYFKAMTQAEFVARYNQLDMDSILRKE